jgi:hypothetical protein
MFKGRRTEANESSPQFTARFPSTLTLSSHVWKVFLVSSGLLTEVGRTVSKFHAPLRLVFPDIITLIIFHEE